MIKKLIHFSAHNRMLVIMLTFAAIAYAIFALTHIPLDAIPDLSDTQVIVYSKWDRSPDIIEDQVTYPIITALLGAPKVKAIRGYSDFGFSYVYVIFKDGTDIYWRVVGSWNISPKSRAISHRELRLNWDLMPRASDGCFSMHWLIRKGNTIFPSFVPTRTGI